MPAATSLHEAKQFAANCVKELNRFTEVIETEEREQLFAYLVGKAKEEWYDEIEKVVEHYREW